MVIDETSEGDPRSFFWLITDDFLLREHFGVLPHA
jgi:hypothetical protein